MLVDVFAMAAPLFAYKEMIRLIALKTVLMVKSTMPTVDCSINARLRPSRPGSHKEGM